MQMYTGTRLTTVIHRRLLSRFFLKKGGTSVHRLRSMAVLWGALLSGKAAKARANKPPARRTQIFPYLNHLTTH